MLRLWRRLLWKIRGRRGFVRTGELRGIHENLFRIEINCVARVCDTSAVIFYSRGKTSPSSMELVVVMLCLTLELGRTREKTRGRKRKKCRVEKQSIWYISIYTVFHVENGLFFAEYKTFLFRLRVFSHALGCEARRGGACTPRCKRVSRPGSVARAMGVQSREIWQVTTGSHSAKWKTQFLFCFVCVLLLCSSTRYMYHTSPPTL